MDTAIENISNASNVTDASATKPPAPIEGVIMAYAGLIIMAVLPIYFGARKSVSTLKKQRDEAEASGEQIERMTHRDAAMFPVIASCALLGLYVFFQLFSKEYVNLLLSLYFAGLGVFALLHQITPLLTCLPIPDALPLPSSIRSMLNVNYRLTLVEDSRSPSSAELDRTDSTDSAGQRFLVDERFTGRQVLGLIPCAALGCWYLVKKHWIANNVFGLVFSVTGVEVIHINTLSIGILLLGGLFIYDVFWVFFTDVMVTVAKTFEAPIKLVFPQDLITNGLSANNFAMLGLGDIVLPGLLISLMLRADAHLRPNKTPIYFWATLVAYVVGLLVTVMALQVYKHAQPALLYLVPACLGTPLTLALIRGEVGQLLGYYDHPADAAEEKTEQTSPVHVKDNLKTKKAK